jgi:RNA ligase partner protein
MDAYVLDTTAVTEARLRRRLGVETLEGVVERLTPILREARLLVGARFYMTPATWSELRRLLIGNNVGLDHIHELGAWITVKPPDKLSVRLPATVFSEYVADVRRRLYKGLRVAEAAVRRAARECPGGGEECVGELIRGLRDRYREATRKGLVDSVEDLDTILLALEMRAVVVSSDEGIIRLASRLGVVTIDPEDWIEALQRMIRAVRSHRNPEVNQ